MMKTYTAKKGEIKAKWHLVDATDKVLGRMATRIATILMGKHRPTYTPHVDTGGRCTRHCVANISILETFQQVAGEAAEMEA